MKVDDALKLIEKDVKIRHASWDKDEYIARCWLATTDIPVVFVMKDGRNGDLTMTLSGSEIEEFFKDVVYESGS